MVNWWTNKNQWFYRTRKGNLKWLYQKDGEVTVINFDQDETEIEADFMCIVCAMLDRVGSKKVADLLERAIKEYKKHRKGGILKWI